MVVGLPITITATSHTAMMSAIRKFAPVVAIAYRRSYIVAVTIVVAMVRVVMVMIIVDRFKTVVVMVEEGIIVQPTILVMPSPTVVETVIIPIW